MGSAIQPSVWVQIGSGAGLSALGLAVAFLMPQQWSQIAGTVLLVLGLGLIAVSLSFHVIEKRVQQKFAALKATVQQNTSELVRPSLPQEYLWIDDPPELESIGQFKNAVVGRIFGHIVLLGPGAYEYYDRGDVNDKRRMRKYIRSEWKWEYTKDELVRAALSQT